jgi:hypothetical protein
MVEFTSADEYLRLGWMPETPRGNPHPVFDAYRVMMVWCCECKLVEPGEQS